MSSYTATTTTSSPQYQRPPQIQTAYLQATPQYAGATGSPLSTTSQQMMMVHTPYSCEVDLVPSNSEAAASQCFGEGETSAATTRDNMLGDSQYGIQLSHSNQNSHNGSFSNLNQSRRSSNRGGSNEGNNSHVSSPQPAAGSRLQAGALSFDPWTGQYDGQSESSFQAASPSSHSKNNTQQRRRGSSHHSSSASSISNSNAQTPQVAARYQQKQNATATSVSLGGYTPATASAYPAFMMRAPILNTPVHAAYLGGKAEYLEMLQGSGAEITTAAQWNRAHKVFIGHVKFEITADGLRWIIYMLTGVQAGKVEVRGMGCFMVFFANTEDVFRVRGLHKRVLFDTQGIWFAQNLDQENELHHYASNVAPGVHAKLPKGLMVVDEETSRRRTRKSKSAGNSKLQANSYNEQAAPLANQLLQGAAAGAPPGAFQVHTQAIAAAFPNDDGPSSAHQLWNASHHHHQFSSGSNSRVNSDEYC